MEEKAKDGAAEEATSCPRRMWKNFQEKSKPFLSPKRSSERRSAEGKRESGLGMLKRKKKQVLDRVFSSSQPNLFSSTPPTRKDDGALCGHPDPSPSKGRGLSAPAAAEGASASKPEISASVHGSPQLTVAHLAASQQKSSSLGSACFERLVGESAASSEDELRKNASDLVSVWWKNVLRPSVSVLRFQWTRKRFV
uniref:Uncharacterized protein n=1 Tax=Electrophorus electricus TaxID=8005 RepID=A0A4W4FY72_ELEEL